jgi:hypothetical protein
VIEIVFARAVAVDVENLVNDLRTTTRTMTTTTTKKKKKRSLTKFADTAGLAVAADIVSCSFAFGDV